MHWFSKKHALDPKKNGILSRLGPGLITGAADDDPSGIATYSQVGAAFGTQYLWLAPWTFPFMAVFQEICGRIGIVTKSGLVGSFKKHFHPAIVYPLVLAFVMTNAVNIGADLQGMAESARLIYPLPAWAYWFAFAGIAGASMVFFNYVKFARILKWFALALLAYVATGLMALGRDTGLSWSSFVPAVQFDAEHLMLVVGVLGTTISPYLFFWQASEEVEEVEDQLAKGHISLSRFIAGARVDTVIGMFASNAIMFFIILTSAVFLHGIGGEVHTAAEAARALAPIAGDFAGTVFALGVIGTGLLAVPVLAGASAYAVAELFDWRHTLATTFSEAKPFYLVLLGTIALGGLVSFAPIEPFEALIYTAVLLGFLAPFIMAMIMILSGRGDVMGRHKNSVASAIGGWTTTALMALAAGALAWNLIF